MRTNRLHCIHGGVRRAHGFTLIELQVSIVIALVLLLAVCTLFISQRKTFSAQNGLAQLQEKERLTATLLAGIIQPAGYYTSPTTSSRATALPAVSGIYAAGQYIVGTTGTAGASDTIRVRYQTASGDGILNCQGGSNSTGGNKYYDNLFTVQTINNTKVLTCALGAGAAASTTAANAVPLVDGLQSMTVNYGVDTVGNGSATQYLTASNVANWNAVRSVRIVLTFVNPNYNASVNDGQPQTIAYTQIIRLMGV
ncbi:MAG: PilW family protein [Burkholderiales bacterium]|nr:PilW family protein [Burkholderiales bacterium]